MLVRFVERRLAADRGAAGDQRETSALEGWAVMPMMSNVPCTVAWRSTPGLAAPML